MYFLGSKNLEIAFRYFAFRISFLIRFQERKMSVFQVWSLWFWSLRVFQRLWRCTDYTCNLGEKLMNFMKSFCSVFLLNFFSPRSSSCQQQYWCRLGKMKHRLDIHCCQKWICSSAQEHKCFQASWRMSMLSWTQLTNLRS